MQKHKFYNKQVHAFTEKEEFLDYLDTLPYSLVIALSAPKIITHEERITELINKYTAYADGSSVVKGLKKKGISAIKYPGCKLWLDYIARNYKTKKFYFIGASQEIIEKTVERLNIDFPGIQIANFRNGFLDAASIEATEKDILEKKPDAVFVAMGSPKQEYLMDDLMRLHPALYFGLGGSFDLYAGKVADVPWWWEKYIAHEGLYRALIDPKKLPRQKTVLKFYWLYLTNQL